MREKEKQQQFSNARGRGTSEEAPSKGSIGEPAPIDDDESFARRAGEIIASAVRAAGHAARRGSKRYGRCTSSR
jgi:hypothetical protein